MNIHELNHILQQSELAPFADVLVRYARPRAIIVRNEPGKQLEVGKSRLNNAPDLPRDFQWPEHDRGPYRFLGQINLGELPNGMPPMPLEGLLSLFYQYDEDCECFWGDAGYVIAKFFTPHVELIRTRQPSVVDIGDPVPISFRVGFDLPYFNPFNTTLKVIDWPLDKDLANTYEQLHESWHDTDEYLFGYPINHTLGYDPTPNYDWQSLLTLGSDEELAWYWHDSDRLVTFIETKKLKTGDFSEIRSDAG